MRVVLWVGTGVGVLLFGVLFFFGAAPSKPYDGKSPYDPKLAERSEQEKWDDYGEKPVSGKVKIKEPFCFWSALMFSLAGLVALFWLSWENSSNPDLFMAQPSWYSVPLGIFMVWMGPGSMWEHGTLLKDWGWFDSSSIHWWAIFVSEYVLMRLFLTPEQSRKPEWIAGFWGVFAIVCGAVGAISFPVTDARKIFTVLWTVIMGLLLVVPELRGCCTCSRPSTVNWWPLRPIREFLCWLRVPPRKPLWLIPTGGCAAVGFVCLFGAARNEFLAKTLSVQENHSWQFHGLWHTMMAATALFIFIYLNSEKIGKSPGED